MPSVPGQFPDHHPSVSPSKEDAPVKAACGLSVKVVKGPQLKAEGRNFISACVTPPAYISQVFMICVYVCVSVHLRHLSQGVWPLYGGNIVYIPRITKTHMGFRFVPDVMPASVLFSCVSVPGG